VIETGAEIVEKVKAEVQGQEIFTKMLKDAKVKGYNGAKIKLSFDSEYKANHFEQYYKVRFEEVAEKIFGKQIEVVVES